MCRAKGFNIQEELDDCTRENLNLYRDIDFLNFVYKSIGSFVRNLWEQFWSFQNFFIGKKSIAIIKPASQPVSDKPESRTTTASRLIPTQLVPPFPPEGSSRDAPTLLESGGLKGMGAGAPAGLVPARLPVDVLLSGLSLTGWLAGWLTG